MLCNESSEPVSCFFYHYLVISYFCPANQEFFGILVFHTSFASSVVLAVECQTFEGDESWLLFNEVSNYNFFLLYSQKNAILSSPSISFSQLIRLNVKYNLLGLKRFRDFFFQAIIYIS